MDNATKKELINYLSGFLTPRRLAKMQSILNNRTRHLTIALEDIYQSHNASAVLRSCECFGIQDVHIIENQNTYEVNPDVALGASKWLTLHKYSGQEFNTPSCLENLKAKGYRLVAASPHKDDCLLEELPLDQKTALLFGTEMRGLTPEAIRMAEGFVKIPMQGFTESFNISVSAAICLYELSTKLRNSPISWQLSEEEKSDLLLDWIKVSIKNPDLLISRYLKTHPNK